jgi:hypothetical protein
MASTESSDVADVVVWILHKELKQGGGETRTNKNGKNGGK